MGWIGNIFLIIGLWLIGYKKRVAFIFTIIGESIWIYYSINSNQLDLAFICLLFAILAGRNFFMWRK
jgi:hypothetical protein